MTVSRIYDDRMETIFSSSNPLIQRSSSYGLEIRRFLKHIPWNFKIQDDIKQLLRSSGSIGANYLEAQEAVSRRDFLHRVRICRKEANESQHWLFLLRENIDEKFHAKLNQ